MILAPLAALFLAGVLPDTRADDLPVFVGLDSSTNEPIMAFDPETWDASVGDVVVFHFRVGNHSLAKSSFENPCSPISNATVFIPVEPPDEYSASWPVTATDPTWFHCRQAGHCASGMVFAVNPPSTEDFNDFKARAMAVATARGAAATGAGSDANPDANPDGACPPDSGTGVDYEVIVGGTDGLSFQPDTITADVGDRVIFVFSGTGIHSVTESSFDTPCGISGFDSGSRRGGASALDFSIEVNDTNPIYGYSKAADDCAQGMVFAINAPETGDGSFATFKDKAMGLPAPAPAPSPTGIAPSTTPIPTPATRTTATRLTRASAGTTRRSSTSAVATTRATGNRGVNAATATSDAHLGGVDMGRRAVNAMMLATLGVVVALAL